MTVCIAARAVLADNTDCIVTVSDTKLTKGNYSVDLGALKLRKIHPSWRAMVAGNFSQQFPLVDSIARALGPITNPTLRQVEAACSMSYVYENKRMVEESILGKYGLTLELFLKSRTDLGDSIYERTWSDIGRIRVACDLLVAGFDERKIPHIFIVSNPTEENPNFVTHCENPAFGAIGSGAYSAESTLYGFNQNSANSLADTIYKTTFAKFTAESASDVGPMTYLYVFDASGEKIPIQQIDAAYDLEGALREIWLESGQPTINQQSHAVIEKALEKPKQ